MDCWTRPNVSFSFSSDRVCVWVVNGAALKDTLRGKPGEFRADNKTNRKKLIKKVGVFRAYEYIVIRWGYGKKRVGRPQSEIITAVSIVFRFKQSVRLEVPQRWGGQTFEKDSWCMEFGEVVEWVGLYRWAAIVGVPDSIISSWVLEYCK